MDEKNITPSMMPKKLHEGVVKLTEEELCKERETIDALELLRRREDKQRVHDKRRAATIAVSKNRLQGEANKEAHIARKNAQKERVVQSKRQNRKFGSLRKRSS